MARAQTNLAPLSSNGRRRCAFTLLELMIALMIAAILAGSLASSVRIAFKGKAIAEAAVEPARAADIVTAFVRNDLQNAVPPNPGISSATGTSSTGANILAGNFDGTSGGSGPADDVIFYTTADSPDLPSGNGEIRQVELTIASPSSGGPQVLLRRINRNLLAQFQPAPDEEVLCRNVTAFKLRYFTGDEWVDEWHSTQEQNALPTAVEMTLELERPTSNGEQHRYRYLRVFPLSCSTVSAINPASTLGGLTP
jgi:prepilin-type N-terminal cleavage/methylation domain-containing protein